MKFYSVCHLCVTLSSLEPCLEVHQNTVLIVCIEELAKALSYFNGKMEDHFGIPSRLASIVKESADGC